MLTNMDRPTSFIHGLDAHSRSQGKNSPQWLAQLRNQALSHFKKEGLPTVHDEDWKYTNLTPITRHQFEIAAEDLDSESLLPEYSEDCDINIVFINGIFLNPASSGNSLPGGVHILTFPEAIQKKDQNIKKLLSQHTGKETSFTALNFALFQNGVYIKIDRDVILEKPIHIIHITNTDHKIISSPRSLIFLDDSSEATVLESHWAVKPDSVYLTNAVTDIFLGENAVIHYTKAQHESERAFHIGTTRVFQKRNSNLDSFSLMTG